MGLKEIFIQDEQSQRLGYEKGTRVTYARKVCSKKDIDRLIAGSMTYLSIAFTGRGLQMEVFFADALFHDALKKAVAKITGLEPEKVRCAQINFSRTNVKFNAITFHEPLQRINGPLEIKRIVEGIDPRFWDDEVAIGWDYRSKFVYFPRIDKLESLE